MRKLLTTTVLTGMILLTPLVWTPPTWGQSNIAKPSTSTWLPAYTAGQSIYLDPQLANHPTAPVRFSASFASKLAQLDQQQGLKFYIVATQQGQEVIPAGTKAGIAKIDQLLPQWINQPGFDRQAYVIILWVRRQDDVTKGSVGVNVGSKARAYGITPELLSDPQGLVIPALRQFMPQDPEAALLQIGSNLNSKIAAAIADQEWGHQAKATLITLVKAVGTAITVGAIALMLLAWRGSRQQQRQRLESLLKEWQHISAAGGELYLELVENQLPRLQSLSWSELQTSDPEFFARYETARVKLSDFVACWSQLSDRYQAAAAAMAAGQQKQVLFLLEKEPVRVSLEKVPIAVSTLLSGLSQERDFQPSDLLRETSQQFETAKSAILDLLTDYDRASQFGTETLWNNFAATENRILQKADTPFMYHLGWGTAPADQTRLSFRGFDAALAMIPLKTQAIEQGKRAWQDNKIAAAAAIYSQIGERLQAIEAQLDQALTAKAEGEARSEQLVESLDQYPSQLSDAQQALQTVQQNYPEASISDLQTTLATATALVERFPTVQQKGRVLYLQQDFDGAEGAIAALLNEVQDSVLQLQRLQHLPQELAEQKQHLATQVDEYRQRLQRLHYTQITYDFDLLQRSLEANQFNTLQVQLASLQHLVVAAEAEEARQTPVESSSTTNNFSSSSSSDYSSSSSGGDYSSSSGGGDY